MAYKKHLSEIDTDLVIEIICGYLKVSDTYVYEKVNEKKIVHCRFMIFFVLSRLFKVDYLEIAKLFDMNHATVFYGAEKVLGDIVLYRERKTEYNDIRKLIIKRMKDIVIIPEADALRL